MDLSGGELQKAALFKVILTEPDVILLAGDVYDRSVPPAEAVELFDEMISEITGKRKIPFIVISGNHDSAERLSFASRILRGTGLFLCGDLYHTLAPVILKDDDGEVAFRPSSLCGTGEGAGSAFRRCPYS